MKVLKHVLNIFIREQFSVDEIQFLFMPGRETTNTIFIFRQLQEKYMEKKKNT